MSAFNQEMWDTSTKGVSICYSLLVSHWAVGGQASRSLALSSSWKLGQLSTPSLSRLVGFPPARSKNFRSDPGHRCIRTFALSHQHHPEPQMCVLQDVGTPFCHLVYTHKRPKRRPFDQISNLQGRRSTGGDFRRIHERALRLLGNVRPPARAPQRHRASPRYRCRLDQGLRDDVLFKRQQRPGSQLHDLRTYSCPSLGCVDQTRECPCDVWSPVASPSPRRKNCELSIL